MVFIKDKVSLRELIASNQLACSVLVLTTHIFGDMYGFVTVIRSPYLSWVSGPVAVQSRHILADWEFLFLFCFLFTFARSVIAVQILQPALRYAGFDAQDSSHLAALGWKILSRGVLMLYAMGLWYESPDRLNPQWLFDNWPLHPISESMKYLFLLRLAFYIHQCLIMVVEPIRSDFTSKFLHHILTCAVVIACCNSRAYSLLYIILLTADLADILLAFVQILKCLNYEKSLRLSLLGFIFIWIFTRHIMFLYFHWVLHHALPLEGGCQVVITGGMMLNPDDPKWEQISPQTQQNRSTICLSQGVKLSLSGISIVLQLLFLMWTVEFVQIAVYMHRRCVSKCEENDTERKRQ